MNQAPQEFDGWLLWPALALLMFGLVMVYSASIATAEGSKFTAYQPAYFLVRHSVFVVIGLIAAVVAFQVPMRVWQQVAPWLFIAGFVLLMLVLVPHVGRSVNGAQRWLPLGPVNL
ncbi:MAG: FtsW/RodA/SpoVE family cell cycle protein, partial [Pseudomonadota bacterium]